MHSLKLKYLVTCISLGCLLLGSAQTTESTNLSDLLEKALLSDGRSAEFTTDLSSLDNMKDVKKGWGSLEKESIGKFLKSKYPDAPTDTSGYLIIDKELKLSIGEINKFQLADLHFTNLTLVIDKVVDFNIKNCYFDVLNIQINHLDNHAFIHENYISESTINVTSESDNARFWLHLNEIDYSDVNLTRTKSVELLENKFKQHPMQLDASDSAFFKVNNRLIDYNDNSNPLRLVMIDVENLTIWKNSNTNLLDEYEFESLTVMGSVSNVKILENELHIPIHFLDLTIGDRLEMVKNIFHTDMAFGLYRVLLPELLINIDWNQFDGKMYILTDATQYETAHGFWQFGALPYFGKSLVEMKYNDRRRELLSTYSKFYNHFKNSGDIEAANAVYKEIQDLNTLYFEYLAGEDANIQNVFRWRLNQLIRYYTEYGTNPIKAVVISMYLMLGFAVFYFFFPSEWDKESKSKTLSHFVEAIKKNDIPVFPSLVKSVYYLIVSAVNAITLSLNSFVTLGFGTIPTKGLARYVCILQGFIGWFLLSLFLVALLNQTNL